MKLHHLFEEQDIEQQLLQAMEKNLVISMYSYADKVYCITDIPKITPQQFEQLLIKSFGSVEKAWPADDYGPLMISIEGEDRCCVCFDDIVGYGDVNMHNVKWSWVIKEVNDFAETRDFGDDFDER